MISNETFQSILTIVHHAAIGFGALGWTYSYALHFVFMVFVLVSWIINNNSCFLSQWQGKQGTEHSSGYFKTLGIDLDEEETHFVNYMLVVYGALVSLAKL